MKQLPLPDGTETGNEPDSRSESGCISEDNTTPLPWAEDYKIILAISQSTNEMDFSGKDNLTTLITMEPNWFLEGNRLQ